MANFLVRGGASRAKNCPPFAVDDPTAPEGGDYAERLHDKATAEDERALAFPKYINGYGGHVPNIKDVAGESYSKCAAKAATTEVTELLRGDTLPPDPHTAVHSTGEPKQGSIITEEFSREHHVSGYTGHVPGLKEA